MSTFYIVNVSLFETGVGSSQLSIQWAWRVKKADYTADHQLVLRFDVASNLVQVLVIPEQDWKQHRTGHHTVNRGCMCSEGKAPDDGHNSARNMLSGVQVNK
jgi:hypothetical protein